MIRSLCEYFSYWNKFHCNQLNMIRPQNLKMRLSRELRTRPTYDQTWSRDRWHHTWTALITVEAKQGVSHFPAAPSTFFKCLCSRHATASHEPAVAIFQGIHRLFYYAGGCHCKLLFETAKLSNRKICRLVIFCLKNYLLVRWWDKTISNIRSWRSVSCSLFYKAGKRN